MEVGLPIPINIRGSFTQDTPHASEKANLLMRLLCMCDLCNLTLAFCEREKKKKTVEGHSSKGERNLNPRSYQQLNVGKQLRFWIWSCNYRSPFTHRTVRRECDLQVSMGCELQATGLGLLHPHQCLANNRLSLDVGVGSAQGEFLVVQMVGRKGWVQGSQQQCD